MKIRSKIFATLMLCALLSPFSFASKANATLIAAICDSGILAGSALSPTIWCLGRWTPGGTASANGTWLFSNANRRADGASAFGLRAGTTILNPSGQLGPISIECSNLREIVDMTGTMILGGITFSGGINPVLATSDAETASIGKNVPELFLFCVPFL